MDFTMRLLVTLLCGWASLSLLPLSGLADEPGAVTNMAVTGALPPGIAKPKTILEARGRAKLLFELASGSLQVMHRDFFDEENSRSIPSASLDDVFSELQKSFAVEMRWLNAGTDIVNTEHQARSDFEIEATKLIKRGEPAVELLRLGEYQFAGAVRLRSQCLKCHLKDRKSNEDRYAALVIRMKLEE